MKALYHGRLRVFLSASSIKQPMNYPAASYGVSKSYFIPPSPVSSPLWGEEIMYPHSFSVGNLLIDKPSGIYYET